jgi:glucose/arabinose dehydrogenase
MKSAKSILISLIIIYGFVMESQSQIFIGSTEIDTNSIVTNLDTPWEILWGPDDHIWLTERNGKISRLNPETSEITELITIGDVNEQGEGGLLGMVLHPDFINHPYVFVVYNYIGSSGIEERLAKYTYSNGELDSPVTLLERIDGAWNHNGSRLVIDADHKLYMTTGDAANTSQSQDLNSLNGKVLRMNLDGSVPEDNPFQGSFVWTWGHRNAQGLVISPLGLMYSSEHGPSSDDEVNIIEKGRNYGWPQVEGFCDAPEESQFCADSNVMEPIAAWTPTLAVAGTDFYHHTAIPEWQNTVLITSLKASQLTVLKLSSDGKVVVSEESFFQNWFGRLRDVCISPDGRVFLAVSNRDGRGSVQTGDDRIVEVRSTSSTVDVHALATLEFSVYPNPVSGNELNMDYTIATEANLMIYSQDGREVSRSILSPGNEHVKIYLPETSGLYNLILTNSEGTRYSKVLKLNP